MANLFNWMLPNQNKAGQPPNRLWGYMPAKNRRPPPNAQQMVKSINTSGSIWLCKEILGRKWKPDGKRRILKKGIGEQSGRKVTLSSTGEKSFMPGKIMEDCWANFSVIYGLTFGQEKSSIINWNNTLIWSTVNEFEIAEHEYCIYFFCFLHLWIYYAFPNKTNGYLLNFQFLALRCWWNQKRLW